MQDDETIGMEQSVDLNEVGTTENSSDNTISEKKEKSEKTISKKTISDKTLTKKNQSEKTINLAERTFFAKTLFRDKTSSEKTISGKTISEKSSKGSSHKFMKDVVFGKILTPKVLSFTWRILVSIILLVLFLVPMGMESVDLMDAEKIPDLVVPWFLPFVKYKTIQESILHIVYFAIYFVPFTSLFFLISLFIKDNINKLLYILMYISLSIYIFCAGSIFIMFANSSRWFATLPWYVYAVTCFSFVAHPCLSVYGLALIRGMNPEYAEYKKMKEETKEHTKVSIKTKLILTNLISLAIILLSFTTLNLRNYNKMFTEAVSDIGRSQAEQTASVYDSADGKYEKIFPFFEQQKEANSYADSPFERIDIIIPTKPITSKDGLYLETITDATELPDFDVLAYTTAIGRVSKIPENEKHITSTQAKEYLRRYRTDEYKKSPVYNKAAGTCKYIYPVSFTRTNGHLLVGFSVVTYKEEVLMKSYFYTKIFVFTMSILFLYLSLIVSLVIADFITNPLLFLRSNVKRTSDTLSMMLSGNSKITAEQLVFNDSIRTKDETKELSLEINNMVSLIRGIVPYISFSTLKNAEKDKPKTSVSRELCFLFTDIRGFTSLCEGSQPKEVVDILNHYLDIETEIILRNGGDIDKFVGDEMMAFFAGPKKEYNACKAAMEIRSALYEQHQIALENDEAYINMGIGVNTGKVIFGSVGSRSRMDFTSIGDTVNLAARLEGANKAYGSKSIISEAVYEKLNNAFICRELDFITVKGKTKPVRIYEILQSATLASDKLYDLKDLFEKGLKEYRKQQWDKAEEYFRLCNEKYTDMPSVVFLNRVEHFKQNPPGKDWDGVFVMSVK